MTVYVDLLFGVNTVINYLLLRGSAAMGGCPAGFLRLLAAAAIGGAYAVAVVLPGLAFLQGGMYQLLSAAVMVLAAFGWKRSTVKQGLFFAALSFAFGGVVLLLVQLAEPDCAFLGGRVYYAVSTPALLLLAGACYGLAALVLTGCGRHTGGDLVPITLELQGHTVQLRALRDTGNTLRDPVTGQGILVAGWQVLAQLLPDEILCQAQFRDPPTLIRHLTERYPELRFRLVTYESVGVGCGMLPAVRCLVREKHRADRLLVAFTATELSGTGQFDALLGGVIT